MERVGRGGDIAVGEDGAGHVLDGHANEVMADLGAVHVGDGAAMDGEEVDGVAGEEGEEAFPSGGVGEPDTSLDGEGDEVDGIAEGAEDGVDACGFAEESAAGALAVHDGRGAAEVEVDGGDRELLELAGGGGECDGVVADELSDGGSAGGVEGEGLTTELSRELVAWTRVYSVQ